MNDINSYVNNIYIDVKNPESDKNKSKEVINVSVFIADEANELYFETPQRAVVTTVERSKYVKLEASGECAKLKIRFNDMKDNQIIINKVAVNSQVPYSFNILRILLIFSVLTSIYLLRPSSNVYEKKIDFKSSKQIKIIGCFLLLQCIFFMIFTFANPIFISNTFSHHQQYQELTDALLNGQFSILKEPPECLKNMTNPYDTALRTRVMSENNASYLWDHAYYDGKYYIYFGIGPVLTFYLPFKIFTNMDFNTHWGILICGVLLIFGIFFLLKEIVAKKFKDTPFVIYLMLCIMFINGCGALTLIKQSTLYNMPIVLGLVHVIWGLYFWISSVREDGTINTCRMFIGSFFMAYVAACRPQMLISSFLAIPIFWNAFAKRNLFSKLSVKRTVFFLFPFLGIAIGLMYYLCTFWFSI